MRRVTIVLFSALLCFQSLLLSYSAYTHSPTWDEVGHLAAGLSHWKYGRFELYSVNPPLTRTIAAAPVAAFMNPRMDWSYYRSDPKLRSEVFLGRRMIELNGDRSYKFFFVARLMVIPVALLGTWLCFLWGRELFGPRAGWIAAWLWVFSPMVLGYGALFTPDLSSAVAVLLASYAFWAWLKKPSLSYAGLFGIAMAIAMLVKSVWLILPAAYFVIWFSFRVIRGRGRQAALQGNESRSRLGNEVVQGLGAICLALLFTNAFYGFRGTATPLGEFSFVSHSLSGVTCEDCDQLYGNRFKDTFLGSLPVPLPAAYLQGIDIQRHDFEMGLTSESWKSYLHGEWRNGGWWYFYLLGVFVKEPLVLWLLVAGATCVALLCRHEEGRPAGARFGWWALFVPVGLLLLVLSANTGLNRYVRYAIPVVPVLVVWASQLVPTKPKTEWGLWDRARWGVTGVGCVMLACNALLTAPGWLAHFNTFAGGSSGGYRVLADSNIDWGQDLRHLQRWLDQHPDAAKDLHLAYFGSFDPEWVGIEYTLPPPLSGDASARLIADQKWLGPQPGWHAISVNYLVGHSMPVPDHGTLVPQTEPQFTYFQDFEPVDRVGNSILIYHLSPADVDRVRLARRMVPLQEPRSAKTQIGKAEGRGEHRKPQT